MNGASARKAPGEDGPGASAWKDDRNGSRDCRLGRRRREALAALLAAGRNHLPAPLGLHAAAKAVRLLAMAIAGTVCALHGSMDLGSAEDRPATCDTGSLHAMSRTGVSAKDGGDYGKARRRVKRRPPGPRAGRPRAPRTSPGRASHCRTVVSWRGEAGGGIRGAGPRFSILEGARPITSESPGT